MKKTSILLLCLVMVTAMFVSCDNSLRNNSPVEVRLLGQNNSRSLNASTEIVNVDDPDLAWHYSAIKASDTAFIYGQTTEEGAALPENGVITLSQGKWNFRIWAEKEGKKVFSGSVDGALIIRNNDGTPVGITIPVSPFTGEKGSIRFSNVRIHAKRSTGYSEVIPNYIVINDDATAVTLDENGSGVAEELDTGSYNVTVAYKNSDGSIVFASETKIVTVYSGRETIISGYVDESTASAEFKPVYNGETNGIKNDKNEVVFELNSVSPSGSMEAATTVAFEDGALDADSAAQYKLSTSVNNNIVSDFKVSSDKSLLATLDFTLTKGADQVSSFSGKTATVSTFIAKGLSNVSIEGPAEATVSDVAYESSTGKLSFKTNHFSEYRVVTTEEFAAYNATKNVAYRTFEEAMTAALSSTSEDIYLLKDVSVEKGVKYEKNNYFNVGFQHFTNKLYGNNHKITVTKDVSFVGFLKNAELNDVEFVLSSGSNGDVAVAVYVENSTFNNVTVSGNLGLSNNNGAFAIYVQYAKDYEKNIFNRCTLNATMNGAGNSNDYNAFFIGAPLIVADGGIFEFNDCTINGKLSTGVSAVLFANDYCCKKPYKVIVNNLKFGSNAEIRYTNTSSQNKFNGIFGVYNSYKDNITLVLDGNTYNELDSFIEAKYDTTAKIPTWISPDVAKFGPVDTTLKIEKTANSDTFTVTKATNDKASKYCIEIGLYTSNENGTLVQRVSEEFKASDIESGSYTSTLRNLQFVDSTWMSTNNVNEDSNKLAGNTTCTLNGVMFYVLPDKNYSTDTTKHNPVNGRYISVSIYDADGSLLSSSNL